MFFATVKVTYFQNESQQSYNADSIKYAIFKFSNEADSGYIYEKPDIEVYKPDEEYEISYEFPFVDKERFNIIDNILRKEPTIDIVIGNKVIGKGKFIFWEYIN